MSGSTTIANLISDAQQYVDELPSEAATFAKRLHGRLLVNVARERLGGEASAVTPQSSLNPVEQLNAILEEKPFSGRLGMHLELIEGRQRKLVTIHYDYDAARERFQKRCEYGVLVLPGGEEAALANSVKWEILVERLADPEIFTMLYPRVRRLLITFRQREFPFVVTGKAGGKTFMTMTQLPELGLHHSYLEEVTIKKEAKLYTAVASKSDISNDRLKGIRSWPGNKRVSGEHWLQPFYKWIRKINFLWKRVG